MANNSAPNGINFRPFKCAVRQHDAATLRRRAYHMAGHALMTSYFLPNDFYLLLLGRCSGSNLRTGEIDAVEVLDGRPTWISGPNGGWTSSPEWTEVLVPTLEKLPVRQQCLMVAAGCAAESLLDISYTEVATKQATGDRAIFQRYLLPAILPHFWERAVHEASECLAEDRPALDRIAEVVERNLQLVHLWNPGAGKDADAFGLKPGTQFREAALSSEQIKVLAGTARHESLGNVDVANHHFALFEP